MEVNSFYSTEAKIMFGKDQIQRRIPFIVWGGGGWGYVVAFIDQTLMSSFKLYLFYFSFVYFIFSLLKDNLDQGC